MEQRVKQQLGEYMFWILALQNQVEQLQKELEELKKKHEDKPKRS